MNSKDIRATTNDEDYTETYPDGSFGIGSKSTDDFSKEDRYQSSDFKIKRNRRGRRIN